MAGTLGAKAVRLLSCARNIRSSNASASQIRYFSGHEERGPSMEMFTEENARPVVWPDEKMGPLNVPDYRFALPGNTGVMREDKSMENQKMKEEEMESYLPENSPERQLAVVSQLLAESDYLDPDDRPDAEMADCVLEKYFENAKVDLSIQDCPQMIYKDFTALFTSMPKDRKLTVITITQHTDNDMSGWSDAVEDEREKLLENFINTSTEICHWLKSHNYWCDFVDPSSGMPYFGSYSNTTFYETDEKYSHLGFHIEDLGCCKAIYHKKWGTKIFVGSLFTEAPKEHKVMQNILKMLN